MDCWQPHTLYFLACLGLCHYGCVAASTKNLATVAGTMEAMVLAASLRPKDYRDATDTVKIFREEATKFYLCFELLLPCARLAMIKSFDGRTLTELRMFKRRLINVATHPSVMLRIAWKIAVKSPQAIGSLVESFGANIFADFPFPWEDQAQAS